MYADVLEQIGLTPEQAEIYQALLEEGPQSASKLDSLTSVSRTYVYQIADELLEKGLISKKKEGRTTVFAARSPDTLLDQAEAEKMRLEQAKNALEGVLPDLKSKYANSAERPVVTYYEGVEGIKKAYMDTIHEGANVSSFLQNSKILPELREWLRNTYVPRRVENNIKARVLVASGTKSDMYLEESAVGLREAKIIPSKEYPFQQEVNIYGNKVSFFNFHNNERPLAIIIENEDIAISMQSFFDLAWNSMV